MKDGMSNVPSGHPTDPQKQVAQKTWMTEAVKQGIDVSGFDPRISFIARLQWALSKGLKIAALYARYSSKKQGSTEDQLRSCAEHAARNRIYVDPELIAVDEAVSGRKSHRVGFERVKEMLIHTPANVLITYSTSRLMRRGYAAHKFLQEEIVDQNLRAIAVTEQLDTDQEDWDFKTGFYSIRDDQFIKTLAKAVRNGQIGLHDNGYITGAIPVGFMGVDDPNAPTTRRGLPRRKLAVDPDQATIIVRAFERVAEGMSLSQAYKLYRAEGGKCDAQHERPHVSSGVPEPVEPCGLSRGRGLR